MAKTQIAAERSCHECGHVMRRDIRDFTITYQGFSSTFPAGLVLHRGRL